MNGIISETSPYSQEIREINAQIRQEFSRHGTRREELFKELAYWLDRDGYSPRVNLDTGKPGPGAFFCTIHGRLIPSRSKVYRVSEIAAISGIEVKRRDLCPRCAHITPLVQTLEIPIAPAP